MTHEQQILLGIGVLAVLSYGLRASGFILARWIRAESFIGQLLQRAPGNLFVAFIVVGAVTGGWPVLAGAAAALLAAVLIRQELAVMAAGALGSALAAWLL